MKRILLALAIIASITACTKPETPSPEPEEDTTTKSYVGCMRSDYPDITISGVSVNDKIIYDLKSACSFSFVTSVSALTFLYTAEITYIDTINFDIFPIAKINVADASNIYIYIPAEILDFDEIEYTLLNGELITKTTNIESISVKEAETIIDNEKFKTDFCKYDIEITKRNDSVIRIVYSGESIHRSMH